MTNEIKEILDRLDKIVPYANVPKELAYMTTNITPQECELLLDYITNLQEEIKRQEKSQVILDNQNAELQERIDKAIEYIKDKYDYLLRDITFLDHDELIDSKRMITLIKILQGEDK